MQFQPEVPSPDEVEVDDVVLQERLEMRNRYVFKEAVAPQEKEVMSNPSTPKPNPEPFFYFSEGKSGVSFNLQLWYFTLQLMKACLYLLFFSLADSILFCSTILRCKMVSFMFIQIPIVKSQCYCLACYNWRFFFEFQTGKRKRKQQSLFIS